MSRAALSAVLLAVLACGDVGAVDMSPGTVPHTHSSPTTGGSSLAPSNFGVSGGLVWTEIYSYAYINSSSVTLTAAGAQIQQVAIPIVLLAGDRVDVYGSVVATKGATAGNTEVAAEQSAGTVTGKFLFGKYYVGPSRYVTAGARETFELSSLFEVATSGVSGTLTLRLFGTSAGSDTDILTADSNMMVRVWRKVPLP